MALNKGESTMNTMPTPFDQQAILVSGAGRGIKGHGDNHGDCEG